MVIFGLLGASQLVLGLSLATSIRDGWRRIGGLVYICIFIFHFGSQSEGIVQGVIVLLGSLIAIALAVMVSLFNPTEVADIEGDPTNRRLLRLDRDVDRDVDLDVD